MAGQGRPPVRRLRVALLGAGASKAAGLPLTEELLEAILPRTGVARWHRVHSPAVWQKRLKAAITVLYPEGDATGFRPSVSDFFTVLEVVAAVHSRRERLPIDAKTLLDDLRMEIALGLHRSLSALSSVDSPHREWLGSPSGPNVIVTSNWDTLLESAAEEANRTVHLLWPRDRNGERRRNLRQSDLVLLKLHGSIDWGLNETRAISGIRLADYYAPLSTPIGDDPVFPAARLAHDQTLRFRSVEGARDDGGTQVGFRPPVMATMAVGNNVQIDSLGEVWDDAYWSLSRASELDVVGYSFPAEDLELRSLLRVATRQAGHATLDPDLKLAIRNPSPEAHERGRTFLGSPIISDYRVAEIWMKSYAA